jgi:hypothetical protein
MITIVNRAILHILDFDSGVTVFSEEELDVRNDSVATFLTKHVEKIFSDPNSKSGAFYTNSQFKEKMTEYLDGNLDFVSFSVYIAGSFHAAIAEADAAEPADLIICDVTVDGDRLLAVLKCNNKVGFTHQVTTVDGHVRNDIINHYAILPNLSQKIDEYVLAQADMASIRFSDKKRSVNGEETYIIADRILDCSSSISQKKAIDLVKSITHKVSENYGQSTVGAVSKAKNYIAQNAETSDYLDPVDLGREVFNASPAMQEEYLKEVKDAGIPEVIKLDRDFAMKKGKSHKIKTDTGIELVFPVDYFANKDFIEFINNPDGTISIELKNIGKIINK